VRGSTLGYSCHGGCEANGRKKALWPWEKGGAIVERESMDECCLREWQSKALAKLGGGKEDLSRQPTVLDWLRGARVDACDVMPSCAHGDD